MAVYLHDVPLDRAKERFNEGLNTYCLDWVLEVEEIPLSEHAAGRVLAEPVWAKQSSPHYHASAMDGFAVKAGMTAGASPVNPVSLTLGDDAAYVDTGDPLPLWA